MPEMVDPVWGRFTPRNKHHFTALEIVGLSCCPCCVPPVCGPDRRSAYARIGQTVVLWLSLVQVGRAARAIRSTPRVLAIALPPAATRSSHSLPCSASAASRLLRSTA